MRRSDTETDIVRQTRYQPANLDAIDRKILGALAEDASRSYAELSAIVVDFHPELTRVFHREVTHLGLC